jgi:hypothetical protein
MATSIAAKRLKIWNVSTGEERQVQVLAMTSATNGRDTTTSPKRGKRKGASDEVNGKRTVAVTDEKGTSRPLKRGRVVGETDRKLKVAIGTTNCTDTTIRDPKETNGRKGVRVLSLRITAAAASTSRVRREHPGISILTVSW